MPRLHTASHSAEAEPARVAIFHVITFLIRAIVGAMAAMLLAVFVRGVGAVIAVLLALGAGLCASCGFGSWAFLRKRGKNDD
jgi:hypothetical protein